MKAKGTPTEGIYRRLSVRMYGDEKFMRLTPPQPCGQWLWVYALTGPHTGAIPGVFVMGKAAMAEALGWESEAFEKAFAEVFGEGLVEFDAKTRIWFIPNAIRHNMPANPNVVRSWRGAWSLLPECAARDRIADSIFTSLNGLSEAFGKAFLEASGKASRKPLPKHPPKQEAGGRRQEQEEVIPPVGPQRGKRSVALGLKAWLEATKSEGQKPIPEDDPVFVYAEEVGIPEDYLRLAWLEFRHRYCEPGAKRYRDWRSVFRKCVRGNWFKLWFVDAAAGTYGLTTVGHQAKKAHEERKAA